MHDLKRSALRDLCPDYIDWKRGCFNMGGSSGGSSGQATTINNQNPWSGQQPYLTQGFEQAKTNLDSASPQFFPNATYINPSPQTEQALTMQQNRATQGSPLNASAQNETMRTLQGDYLNQGNPAFNGMVNRAIQPLTQQFQNVVAPSIGQRFQSAGRSNSGIAETAARQMAGDSYLRSVGDAASQLSYQDYGAERGRMQNAAGMAPTLAATDYQDIGQLGQVGAIREGIAGQQLQDQMARWNFEQNLPDTKLRQYMSLVGGGSFGGTGTSTSPIQSANPWLMGLGAAGTTAGIAGSLFGNGGVFPGALGKLF